MRKKLRGAAPSIDVQRAHDRHTLWAPLAVIAVLALCCWLFTNAGRRLGLPSPQDVAEAAGLRPANVFDGERFVSSTLYASKTERYPNELERLVGFAAIAAAFLWSYYARVERKHLAFVACFLAGFVTLYGLPAAAAFLAAHLAVYTCFHPKSRDAPGAAAGAGALLPVALVDELHLSRENVALLVAGTAALGLLTFRHALAPLLERERLARVVRAAIVQAPLVAGIACALAQGWSAATAPAGATAWRWSVPVGLLFFLLQWERLLVYHIDRKDGEVPEDLPLLGYITVFTAPQLLLNCNAQPYVGQGYSYLASSFLREDKNALVRSGLRLIAYSILSMTLAEWAIAHAIAFLGGRGVIAYDYTDMLVRKFVGGAPVTTATVLLSTFLDQARVWLVYGSIAHFRVGAWRLLGHDVDPQYDKPWVATNLVTFWGRFAFHYREFLVRAFYYPVFLRLGGMPTRLRVFLATMAATTIRNFIWGHVPDKLYDNIEDRAVTFANLVLMLRAWPYYLLLGLGISTTQWYLMRPGRTRKAWTLDRRLPLDVLAACLTMLFFSLIHVFARPLPGSTLADHVTLFLRGLGLS